VRSHGSRFVSLVSHPRALPQYTVPDSELGTGASLGNSAIWVNTKGTGAIERVFNIELGESLVGAVTLRYADGGKPLRTMWDAGARGHERASYAPLRRETPGTFDIHPAYQRHRFCLAGYIDIVETAFVPLGPLNEPTGDAPIVYQLVELRSRGAHPHRLRIAGFARLRGSLPSDVVARYDPTIHALVAHNAGRPEATRIFGVEPAPTGFETTFDFGRAYDPSHLHSHSNAADARGDILGGLQIDIELKPGESHRLAFATGAYSYGDRAAVDAYKSRRNAELELQRTIAYLEETLPHSEVLTPDPVINQGALWSKVNMRRVMAAYPQASAFTNDPGNSSNIVCRDAAWFVYGNDHFLPDFSRALLDRFAQAQYPDGKLPEFYNAITGEVEDDGLNINDDTPLFVLAVNHHWRAAGDLSWLRGIYPAVAKAAHHIIAQIDDRGLVFCSAFDPRGSVWAIASWRNIIPLYSINGTVTEINAECVAALRAAGHLAENVGLAFGDDAQEFAAASRRVQSAMDRHLRNPDNGLYYLNIDVDGNVHTDVTGDQIFPVMFRACDEQTGYRVISRLNSPDFWTPAGLRTASRFDPLYDPSSYWGLIGGVWPGLTWWYAFAAARYHPEFMVKALRSSFEHYGVDPKANNTVPGQFSEWFDGENLVNRGMRLSPWEPPRFLWAAVEGVCGLMLTPGLPRVDPLVPSNWKWVGLRRVPYHGRELTYFATRQAGHFHIYATADVEGPHDTHRYDEDITERVAVFSDAAAIIALRREAEILLLVGNVGTQTATAPLDIGQVLAPASNYDVSIYNSERDAWEPGARRASDELCSIAVSVESNGYRLVRLRKSP